MVEGIIYVWRIYVWRIAAFYLVEAQNALGSASFRLVAYQQCLARYGRFGERGNSVSNLLLTCSDTKMSINWDSLANESSGRISTAGGNSEASGHAAARLPKDNEETLLRFISSLQKTPQKCFVANVVTVASTMSLAKLEPLMVAALLEPNPSAGRVFVGPCVRVIAQFILS